MKVLKVVLVILAIISSSCDTPKKSVQNISTESNLICKYLNNKLTKLSPTDSCYFRFVNENESKLNIDIYQCLTEQLSVAHKVDYIMDMKCAESISLYCLILMNSNKIGKTLELNYMISHAGEDVMYKLLYDYNDHEILSDEFVSVIVN